MGGFLCFPLSSNISIGGRRSQLATGACSSEPAFDKEIQFLLSKPPTWADCKISRKPDVQPVRYQGHRKTDFPIEKHPTFFVRSSSLLLPLTPERQRNEKNVVRRSFPKERQPNKTLHILSFLPRFIRSTIILSSNESKTKKEAMMSFHTRSCNLT